MVLVIAVAKYGVESSLFGMVVVWAA